eukprot:8277122-Pyramimonas_sp.AAC.1
MSFRRCRPFWGPLGSAISRRRGLRFWRSLRPRLFRLLSCVQVGPRRLLDRIDAVGRRARAWTKGAASMEAACNRAISWA